MNWNNQKTVHEIQWNSSYFFISVIVDGYCCIDKVCAIWTCAMSAGHCALQIILSAGASQITTTTFAATSHHFQKIFRGYWKVRGNWRKTFFINPPSSTFRLHLTVPLFPNTNLIIDSIAVILHCCRSRRQGLRFNACHIACNLFTKLLMPQKVKVIIFLATIQNYHRLFTCLLNILIGRLPWGKDIGILLQMKIWSYLL